MLHKRGPWVCVNNGEIVFTYSEAEKLGLSRKQFRDCTDDVIAHGFIDVTKIGGGLMGDKSLYVYCTPFFRQ